MISEIPQDKIELPNFEFFRKFSIVPIMIYLTELIIQIISDFNYLNLFPYYNGPITQDFQMEITGLIIEILVLILLSVRILHSKHQSTKICFFGREISEEILIIFCFLIMSNIWVGISFIVYFYGNRLYSLQNIPNQLSFRKLNLVDILTISLSIIPLLIGFSNHFRYDFVKFFPINLILYLVFVALDRKRLTNKLTFFILLVYIGYSMFFSFIRFVLSPLGIILGIGLIYSIFYIVEINKARKQFFPEMVFLLQKPHILWIGFILSIIDIISATLFWGYIIIQFLIMKNKMEIEIKKSTKI